MSNIGEQTATGHRAATGSRASTEATTNHAASTQSGDGAFWIALQPLVEAIRTRPEVAGPVVAALAYLLGIVSTSAFAASFGASPSDLGVDFRDQLTIAFANLLLTIAILVSAVAIVRVTTWLRAELRSFWRWATWVLIVLVAAVWGLAAWHYFNVDLVTYIAAWLVLLVLQFTIRAGREGQPWRGKATAGLVAVLIGVLILNTYRTGAGWGDELVTWAEDCQTVECGNAPVGPWGLALVFQPEKLSRFCSQRGSSGGFGGETA